MWCLGFYFIHVTIHMYMIRCKALSRAVVLLPGMFHMHLCFTRDMLMLVFMLALTLQNHFEAWKHLSSNVVLPFGYKSLHRVYLQYVLGVVRFMSSRWQC